MLYVHGDDYANWEFEKQFNQQQMLNDVEDELTFKHEGGLTGFRGVIKVKLQQFGNSDDSFTDFIKSAIQTPQSRKHNNFYIFTKIEVGNCRTELTKINKNIYNKIQKPVVFL